MIHFYFTEKDTRYMFLKCDMTDDEWLDVWDSSVKKMVRKHAFELLKKHINLTDPICYLPTYTGPPFTQDFIFEYVQPSGDKIMYASIGLWQVVWKFLRDMGIQFDGLDSKWFKRDLKHTFEEFVQIVDSWGLKFKPRPYQYEAAYKILQWRRSVSELATRAGKTLIAYMIFRYAIEWLGAKKILMIVPSIDLVKQGYNDFNEYAEFFKAECVWSGGKLVESSNLTIGTFQSLIKFLDKKSKKYDPKFFNGYDLVFVDETHRATAAQVKTIISQPFMQHAILAFGMTGTVPQEKTIPFYCLHALLGARIQTITPRELMDAGYISDIHIQQCVLKYQDVSEQLDLFIKCAEYAIGEFVLESDPGNPHKKHKVPLADQKFLMQYEKQLPGGVAIAKASITGVDEMDRKRQWAKTLSKLIKASTSTNALVVEKMMVHFMDQRLEWLCREVLSKCEYNTLVLAHHTEYIRYVVQYVTEHMPEKKVCCITGSTSAKQRDKVKETLASSNDCILIASYGCVGTGITLSNLCFGVLLESFKSNVINMQSLGRGLGLSKYKDHYEVYDVIDKFDKSVSTNAIWRQGREKQRIYRDNKYDYEVIEYKL